MLQINNEERVYALATSQLKGVGIKRFILIRKLFSNYSSFWRSSKSTLVKTLGESLGSKIFLERNAFDMQLMILRLEKSKQSYFIYGEEDYPYKLSQINDPPKVIFYEGDFDQNIFSNAFTIVGTRNFTNYSIEILDKFIPRLVENNIATVSGLALGVDYLVHSKTLDAGGRTIAVLPTSIDQVVPRIHYNLYEKIKEKGFVISEFFPGTPIVRENFPLRNRILAGLTSTTIVIEAPEKSGSLITADLAFDYNRDLFAFPGDIFMNNSKGCNKIIEESKAKIIYDIENFLQNNLANFTQSSQKENIIFQDKDQELIYKILKETPLNIQELTDRVDIHTSKLLASLSVLELNSIIAKNQKEEYFVLK